MSRSKPLLLLLLLLLPTPGLLGSPSFLDYDYDGDECEDGACWDRTTFLEAQQIVDIPNSSLKVKLFCLCSFTFTTLPQVTDPPGVEG